jgi:hypothetical protein
MPDIRPESLSAQIVDRKLPLIILAAQDFLRTILLKVG